MNNLQYPNKHRAICRIIIIPPFRQHVSHSRGENARILLLLSFHHSVRIARTILVLFIHWGAVLQLFVGIKKVAFLMWLRRWITVSVYFPLSIVSDNSTGSYSHSFLIIWTGTQDHDGILSMRNGEFQNMYEK